MPQRQCLSYIELNIAQSSQSGHNVSDLGVIRKGSLIEYDCQILISLYLLRFETLSTDRTKTIDPDLSMQDNFK